METLDKGMSRILDGTEWSRTHKILSHYLDGTQFKTYELFTKLFHLILSDLDLLQVIETSESETKD